LRKRRGQELFGDIEGKHVNLRPMQELSQDTNSQESSRVIDLDPEGFKEVFKAGIDLNQLYLLENYNRNIDPIPDGGGVKLEALRSSLIRKGLITESNYLTPTGNLLLITLKSGTSFSTIQKARKAYTMTEFERFWKGYPNSDMFEYKGKKFAASRAFKVKKEECKKKFIEIVAEGEYTADEIIKAMECDVLIKKEASIREGENKLKYMQNTLTYLNQRTWEGFIDIAKTYKPTSNSNIVNI
jgi:hypothetical protein